MQDDNFLLQSKNYQNLYYFFLQKHNSIIINEKT